VPGCTRQDPGKILEEFGYFKVVGHGLNCDDTFALTDEGAFSAHLHVLFSKFKNALLAPPREHGLDIEGLRPSRGVHLQTMVEVPGFGWADTLSHFCIHATHLWSGES
jgi:hypothetical protein